LSVSSAKNDLIPTRYVRPTGIKRILISLKNSAWLQLLMLPGLIYFIIFKYIPMYGVVIAFKDYRIVDGIFGSEWVGLKHFLAFFNNPYAGRLIRNTLIISAYSLVFTFPLPIIFALLLNELRPLWYKRFVQTVSYLPHFISLTAVIGMIVMFVSPSQGIVNKLLHSLFGVEPIHFLAEAKWFRTLYITSEVWTGLGWSAIIYIAALSGVDMELYEAAAIDGATRVKQMIHVSLPSIKTTIIVLLILRLGGMMSVGSERVLLLYNTLTYETADVISTYVYRRGLTYFEYSFATAVDVFNSVINIMLLVIANALSRKFAESSLW
jgi:putative aldouronate transport system permease protein